MDVLRLPTDDVMDPIFFSALSQVLHHTSQNNMTGRKIEALEVAVDAGRGANGETVYEQLIGCHFLNGDFELAEKVADTATGVFPDAFFIKFYKALLLKKSDER